MRNGERTQTQERMERRRAAYNRVGAAVVDSLQYPPESVPADNWQADALCAQTDAEAHFPDRGGSTKAAKRVCAMCDVTGECLNYALENDEKFGIWGGLSERERRKLKKVQNGETNTEVSA